LEVIYSVCDDATPANCATATLHILVEPRRVPEVLIEKESASSTFEADGEVLIYTIKVTNTGNVILSNVLVTDPLTGMNETIVSMAAGSTQIFTTSYTVTIADVNARKVSNTANTEFVYEGVTFSSSATKVVDFNGVINLITANMDNLQDTPLNILESRVAGNVLSNDLMNGMPINPGSVQISIVNNAGLTGLVIDQNGDVIVPDGTPAGSYAILYSICDLNNISNCSEAMVLIEVMNGVNLRIIKVADSRELYEGDDLSYTIIVENNGNTPATNVVVTDLLPEGIRYQSSEVNGGTAETSVNGQDIKWSIALLAPGAVFEIKLKVKVLALPNEQERTIVNVATVTSSETELSPENNTSSAVIQVQPFFIPNVITPNGDGSNDRFEIKGLGRFVSNEIVIINRWGDSVYQRVNYQNDWSANGLSNGTYFYVLVTIDEAGKRHEFKGWIQVITE
jgi:uncharacterized repeat protein (TIGR01451 family)/gliding motility-associated-like protein